MPQCAACIREPTLGELLAEPIIQMMMKRDGVARPAIENLMRNVAISQTAADRQAVQCNCAPCKQ